MDKSEALERLMEIVEELSELSHEARDLVAEHFPREEARADAYGMFDFGDSHNPYDQTFSKLVEGLEEQAYSDEPEDDDDDDEDYDGSEDVLRSMLAEG